MNAVRCMIMRYDCIPRGRWMFISRIDWGLSRVENKRTIAHVADMDLARHLGRYQTI
jgi:hypothetical protein